jgi:predicted nucleic acid-binding protein
LLIDSDIFSYLSRRGDARVEIHRPKVLGKLICVSFVTVGEALFGAYKRKWGHEKLRHLQDRLRSVVVVPYDIKVCSTYADLKARIQAKGENIADNDLWIASCAVRHSVPLLSNNRKHFVKVPDLILI